MKRDFVSINHITFWAVDSTGTIIRAKLASQMHGQYQEGIIEVGTIIKLLKFQVIYYEYNVCNGLAPINLLVLCLNVSVHGKYDLFFYKTS